MADDSAAAGTADTGATDQVDYAEAELLASHRYAEPLQHVEHRGGACAGGAFLPLGQADVARQHLAHRGQETLARAPDGDRA